MLIYRLCRQDEIDSILKKRSLTQVGSYPDNIYDNKKHTHQLDPIKKYLYFFPKKENILYLNTMKNRFICTYDIPDDILKKCEGFGLYYDLISFNRLEKIKEYAIDTQKLSIDYLIDVNVITKNIDFYDYLENPKLNGFIKKYKPFEDYKRNPSGESAILD